MAGFRNGSNRYAGSRQILVFGQGFNLHPSVFLIVESLASAVLHLPLVIAGADPLTTERDRFQNFLDLREGHLLIALQPEPLLERAAL
jgi:hypothetical protein